MRRQFFVSQTILLAKVSNRLNDLLPALCVRYNIAEISVIASLTRQATLDWLHIPENEGNLIKRDKDSKQHNVV